MLNVVELWQLDLADAPGRVGAARELLSDDERRRLARLPRGRRAERFARARAALRVLLGQRLGVEPARVAFRYGANGKPQLAGVGDPALEFNVSHSGTLGVVAIARGRRVGVDVQELRPELAWADLARRFYARGESQLLDALPEAQRREHFFRWWTRKEALVKAHGDRVERGLATPVADAQAPISGCSRCDLALPAGWVGALAVEGGPFEVRRRQLAG